MNYAFYLILCLSLPVLGAYGISWVFDVPFHVVLLYVTFFTVFSDMADRVWNDDRI